MYFSKRNPFRFFSLVIYVSVLGFSPIAVWPSLVLAQTESLLTEEEQLRMQRAQLRTIEAQADSAEAAADLARTQARLTEAQAVFPTLAPNANQSALATPPPQFESTLLAYQAMENVADEMQQEIDKFRKGQDIALILVGGNEQGLVLDVVASKGFTERVKAIEAEYRDLRIDPSGPEAAPFVSAGITFLTSLASRFRTDNIFQGVSITIDDNAFMAELASQFRTSQESGQVTLFNPTQYPIQNNTVLTDLAREIGGLETRRSIAEKRLATLTGKPERELTDIEKNERSKLLAVNERVTKLIEELTRTSDQNAILPSVVRGRTLEEIKEDNDRVYYLAVDVIAGGTNRLSRSLFVSRLRHSGGTIVPFSLYDSDTSNIVYSGIIDSYVPFTKVEAEEAEDE